MRKAEEKILTDKDMSVLREGASAKEQHKSSSGIIRDYSVKHRIQVDWDLNPEAKRDRMFRLMVDDKEVIIDAEEMMRYLRWV